MEIRCDMHTVNDIFVDYLDGKFCMREYKGKRLFDLEDKRTLVGWMINGLPLPSITILKKTDDTQHGTFEVIQGVQRIATIVSFMLGDFAVVREGAEYYFDLKCNSTTLSLLQNKDERLKFHEGACFLSVDECTAFSEYKLSVEIEESNSKTINLLEMYNMMDCMGLFDIWCT
ncbi:MAG: hypothetical protein NC393_04110 [Clostridium sp.]|nr:hypothetical protein [Clostridium sp.]MCM1208967.1 hypothetical protein [Ruminococcus sp.]